MIPIAPTPPRKKRRRKLLDPIPDHQTPTAMMPARKPKRHPRSARLRMSQRHLPRRQRLR